MLIDFEEHGEWLVARPQFGRLDAATADDFSAGMAARSRTHPKIILDLTQITFIDSRGLAVLVSVLKSLPKDGTLRLANVADQVDVLLRMTRVNQLLSIFSSVDAAAAA